MRRCGSTDICYGSIRRTQIRQVAQDEQDALEMLDVRKSGSYAIKTVKMVVRAGKTLLWRVAHK